MTPEQPYPVADWVNPGEMLADPYPTYERLREESPVAWVPAMNSVMVTSYDACRQIEMDSATFSAQSSTNLMPRTMGHPTMLNFDDPEHEVVRRPINSGLRPKAMKEIWAPVFERNTRLYLDALAHRGPDDADLNRDFAAPLASQNLMDLLGITGVDPETVRRWSSALIAGLGNISQSEETWSVVDAARAEIDSLLDELVPHLRAHPDHSFTSALVAAGLPDEVVGANVKLALSGGMNEPQHAITSMVWLLSEHPDQRDAVLDDPATFVDVFDETLRYISPVGYIPRVVQRDTELEGVAIPAGSLTSSMVGSANRDRHQFDAPDVFDIHREKRAHFAFGSGVHLCAGMWAAKWSVGHIAVPLLYERFRGLRSAEDRESHWWGFIFRGLTAHPVTWDDDRGAGV